MFPFLIFFVLLFHFPTEIFYLLLLFRGNKHDRLVTLTLFGNLTYRENTFAAVTASHSGMHTAPAPGHLLRVKQLNADAVSYCKKLQNNNYCCYHQQYHCTCNTTSNENHTANLWDRAAYNVSSV